MVFDNHFIPKISIRELNPACHHQKKNLRACMPQSRVHVSQLKIPRAIAENQHSQIKQENKNIQKLNASATFTCSFPTARRSRADMTYDLTYIIWQERHCLAQIYSLHSGLTTLPPSRTVYHPGFAQDHHRYHAPWVCSPTVLSTELLLHCLRQNTL